MKLLRTDLFTLFFALCMIPLGCLAMDDQSESVVPRFVNTSPKRIVLAPRDTPALFAGQGDVDLPSLDSLSEQFVLTDIPFITTFKSSTPPQTVKTLSPKEQALQLINDKWSKKGKPQKPVSPPPVKRLSPSKRHVRTSSTPTGLDLSLDTTACQTPASQATSTPLDGRNSSHSSSSLTITPESENDQLIKVSYTHSAEQNILHPEPMRNQPAVFAQSAASSARTSAISPTNQSAQHSPTSAFRPSVNPSRKCTMIYPPNQTASLFNFGQPFYDARETKRALSPHELECINHTIAQPTTHQASTNVPSEETRSRATFHAWITSLPRTESSKPYHSQQANSNGSGPQQVSMTHGSQSVTQNTPASSSSCYDKLSKWFGC